MARSIELEMIRNIGIMAHIDAGKTTTTERILYYTGVQLQDRRGPRRCSRRWTGWNRSKNGASRSRPRRRHAIWDDHIDQHHRYAGPCRFHRWRSNVPLRVLDGAVAVFDGVAGVEPQTETVWRQADKYRRTSHLLRQQDGPYRCRFLWGRRQLSGSDSVDQGTRLSFSCRSGLERPNSSVLSTLSR